MNVELTGPAATRLRRLGVARRPSAFFQCESLAPRLRFCRCLMCRTNLRRRPRMVCETTQKTLRTSSTVISGYFSPQPVPLQDQPVVRQEGECGVVVPTRPGSGFVIPEP